MDQYRRHRPVHDGAGHRRPDEPRTLEEWDGFTYQVVGAADDLTAAQQWVNERPIGDDSATLTSGRSSSRSNSAHTVLEGTGLSHTPQRSANSSTSNSP
ncbi:hypothetical protein SHIRM173S_01020 [Streptomyces hirsutus]